jgi:hypothetical protein
MRRVRRIAPVLLAGAGLVLLGCTAAPRPFQPAKTVPNELLLLPDRAGITVSPLTGDVPDGGTALAKAMAEALRKQNIPATVGSGNRATRWLLGDVRTSAKNGAADDLTASLTWELYGKDGEPLGDLRQSAALPAAAYRADAAKALGAQIRQAAGRIAGMVQGPRHGRVPLPGYPEGTRIVIGQISGEPGEAARALAKSMAAHLRRRDLPLADRAQPGDVVVSGELTLGESNGTNRPLELVWSLQRAGDDGQMGDLRQANRVPDAEIARGWSRLSRLIARAAAPGVLQVLRANAPAQ